MELEHYCIAWRLGYRHICENASTALLTSVNGVPWLIFLKVHIAHTKTRYVSPTTPLLVVIYRPFGNFRVCKI